MTTIIFQFFALKANMHRKCFVNELQEVFTVFIECCILMPKYDKREVKSSIIAQNLAFNHRLVSGSLGINDDGI